MCVSLNESICVFCAFSLALFLFLFVFSILVFIILLLVVVLILPIFKMLVFVLIRERNNGFEFGWMGKLGKSGRSWEEIKLKP